MKQFLVFFLAFLAAVASGVQAQTSTPQSNKEFVTLLAAYYEEGLKLDPITATSNGDNRYNDLLVIEFTDSYQAVLTGYITRYLTALSKFNRETLSSNDRLSYDILKWQLQTDLEGLSLKRNLPPFTQFGGIPLFLAQLGSGTVVQPFKTVKDYDDWLKRASGFAAWTDSALVYFKRGIAESNVLPKSLVTKMIPQMESFVTTDVTKSVFYGPITHLPTDFPKAEKKRLLEAYVKIITNVLVPSYQKLGDFLQNEYLPKARASSGIGDIPDGDKVYNYRIKWATSTSKMAEELHQTGIQEVQRIQAEMEKTRKSLGFKGDLKALFEYMRTDPKFFPYKTPQEVLRAYQSVEQVISPHLKKLFLNTPRTPFEIRQTESFRAASAAPQYAAGAADGSRPGIFYVPIIDAAKTSMDESIFLHEAIPGHHYQLMLQRENEKLPDFRRYGRFIAYSEGWGLYTESLGKELGVYTDPYQYLRALSWDIHRAIRLIVDTGLHAKGWTREQAIQYMMENEPISEQFATAEIERYMAMPGQALAYKAGSLKIQELRNKYNKQLGPAFNLAAFHHEILKDGPMPLQILEQKMDVWAKGFSK